MSHEYYLHVSTVSISLYITLHYITLHYATLHYITLHYTALHTLTLHYITLHYTTLRYITLHYTALHYITYYTIRVPYHNILVHGHLVPHPMVRSRPEKTGPRCPHTKSASTKVSTSKNMCKGNKTWKNPISQFGLSIFGGIT